MIHNGFYIAQVFQGALYRVICYTNLDAIVSATHLTFTFCQTFFVFKNHKVRTIYTIRRWEQYN